MPWWSKADCTCLSVCLSVCLFSVCLCHMISDVLVPLSLFGVVQILLAPLVPAWLAWLGFYGGLAVLVRLHSHKPKILIKFYDGSGAPSYPTNQINQTL
jgi:hypothetical protein